jgi:hypothetical protein
MVIPVAARRRRRVSGFIALEDIRPAPFLHPSRQQFAAAGDVEMAVERFDVMVHGIGAEAHFAGDLLFAVAGQQVLQRLPLARREAAAPCVASGTSLS